MDDTDSDWAINEFESADLGDKRRTERLIQLATSMMGQPDGSLPVALKGMAELKAAYRFFDNPANEHQAILESHVRATCRRMAQTPLVLAVQDTCYLDYSHHPATRGLGPTTSERQQGIVLHSTLAITPDKVILGIIQEQVWTRDADTYAKLEDHKLRKITEKESYKWLDSLKSVIELHKALPDTHFVSVGDREADVYDLFIKERPVGVDLLVRAIRNRRIENDEQHHLWASLQSAPLAAAVAVQVPRTPKRIAHTAQLELRWKQVTFCPPKHRTSEQLPSVTLWAVWANETTPPEGSEPVEWMLLTTDAVHSTQDALEKLEWYTCRWGIEVWHKVLKSGCRIESRQLEDAENIKRMLAVYSIIAWRIIYAGMLARFLPDAPCSLILEDAEWQALYCTINHTQTLPNQPPTLREAIRMIGRLGGFLGRKADGEPGVQALWIGFRRLHDLTQMYNIMRPHPPLAE